MVAKIRPVGLLLLAVALTACATMSLERNAVNVLNNVATAYETAMPVVADLYKQGLMTEEEKEKAVQAAMVMWTAYHEAQLALEVYHATKAAPDEAKLEAALKAVAKRLTEFYDVVKPLLQRAGR